MKTYLECIPCFLKQSLQAAKIATEAKNIHKKILDEVSKMIPSINLEDSPPVMGRKIHKLVQKLVNNNDPYKKIKEKYNKLALAMEPFLKEKLKNAEDKLLTAIKIAIAGNIIDFGAQLSFDLDRDLNDVLYKDFAIFDYDIFKEKIKRQKIILYLGDNAGETVFDKIFIEFLKENYNIDIIYVVKEKPIINDATKEDAYFAGIDKFAKVISSGSDAPGTVLKYCNPEFLDLFNNSDFIISKGQGNYEALSDEKRPIFFLFKIKCDVLARDMKKPLGSIILKYGGEK